MTTERGLPLIEIRDITELAEMREVENLQKDVWGVEDLEVFPALALRPMTAVGAILIGAFSEGRLIGFVFGFPGLDQGEITLHSDMLAVQAEYRSRGLGYRLKLAQRERAIERGISTITWTFDPLQAANAHLNFARLGVIGNRYLVNFYGDTTSFLHQSGTDRLWLTWQLTSPRVKKRIEEGFHKKSNPAESQRRLTLLRVGANNAPEELSHKPEDEKVFIEIPGNVNALAGDDFDLVVRWREATRSAFTIAFDAGYHVEEFFRSSHHSVGVYQLIATGEGRRN